MRGEQPRGTPSSRAQGAPGAADAPAQTPQRQGSKQAYGRAQPCHVQTRSVEKSSRGTGGWHAATRAFTRMAHAGIWVYKPWVSMLAAVLYLASGRYRPLSLSWAWRSADAGRQSRGYGWKSQHSRAESAKAACSKGYALTVSAHIVSAVRMSLMKLANAGTLKRASHAGSRRVRSRMYDQSEHCPKSHTPTSLG
jgi:hypothetical protein